jgi:hypothetical protein
VRIHSRVLPGEGSGPVLQMGWPVLGNPRWTVFRMRYGSVCSVPGTSVVENFHLPTFQHFSGILGINTNSISRIARDHSNLDVPWPQAEHAVDSISVVREISRATEPDHAGKSLEVPGRSGFGMVHAQESYISRL